VGAGDAAQVTDHALAAGIADEHDPAAGVCEQWRRASTWRARAAQSSAGASRLWRRGLGDRRPRTTNHSGHGCLTAELIGARVTDVEACLGRAAGSTMRRGSAGWWRQRSRL